MQNKKEAIKKIKKIILFVKETQDNCDQLTDKLEALEIFNDKNL